MAKRKNDLFYAYQHEYNRLMRSIRNYQKQGYTFAKNAIPKKPSEYKNISKATVEKIKGVTGTKLIQSGKATYVSSTGKKVKGAQALKEKRTESAKAGHRTRKKERDRYDNTFEYEEPVRKSYPVIDLMDEFMSRVKSLPDVRYGKRQKHIDLSGIKDELSARIKEIKSTASLHWIKARDMYDYLVTKLDEIDEAFEVLQYDSDQGRVYYAHYRIMNIFNSIPENEIISPKDIEEEFYEDWYDDDEYM